MKTDPRLTAYLDGIRRQFEDSSIPVICGAGGQTELFLEMEDGVRLRTWITKPDRGSRFPVILIRTCYTGQIPELEVKAEEFARRGFACVVQWCRGINGSGGEWVPNIYDRSDGLCTMNWLNGQDWAESIGYWGDSYLAYTGWCMADSVPDKCRTMYLGVYGCDRHVSAYKDGLFRQDILTGWAMQNAGKPISADYLESAAFRPQAEVDEKLWGVRLDWYRDWITNTDRDCEYWSTGLWRDLREVPGKMKIPVLIREGWFDHHLGSAIATYTYLSEEARTHTTLRIGPWNHSYRPALTETDVGSLEDESVKVPLEWIYRILVKKEIPDGEVQTYVCGEDRWESNPSYPLQKDREAVFFLDASVKKAGAFGLAEEEGQTTKTGYVYDPEHPVLSYGTTSSFTQMEVVGSLRQPPCGWRPDVLSFVSAPLQKDLQINGQIIVRLCVSSDAPDTAFTAKIMEIRADKKAFNIRDSITTLGYRGGSPHRIPYEKDSVVQAEIVMWDISWTLKKGSRLRLDISSSDFPQYAVHPNREGPWSLAADTVPAAQTVYTGKGYPSAVILPVKQKNEKADPGGGMLPDRKGEKHEA